MQRARKVVFYRTRKSYMLAGWQWLVLALVLLSSTVASALFGEPVASQIFPQTAVPIDLPRSTPLPSATLVPSATLTATEFPSATPTPEGTLTPSPTFTKTQIPSRTPTATRTPRATWTASRTRTATSTPTATHTKLPSPTQNLEVLATQAAKTLQAQLATAALSNTPTRTRTATTAPLFTPTRTSTATPLPTSTLRPPQAALPRPTLTPSLTYTPRPTRTFTATPTTTVTRAPSLTPTVTRTPLPTSTLLPTRTPRPTITLLPTLTPTFTPTVTLTRTPVPTWTRPPTRTSLPTLTFTSTPTITLTPSLTSTATATRTRIPTWTPFPTRTPRPTWTPTATRTLRPTLTFTSTPSRIPSPTRTPLYIRIKVYFTDNDRLIAGQLPYEVPVTRFVPTSKNVVNSVLDEFFKGPGDVERNQGLAVINNGFTGYSKVILANGGVYVYLTGNCVPNGTLYTIARPLMANLKQFPEIKFVKIYDQFGNTLQPAARVDSIPACLDPSFKPTLAPPPTSTFPSRPTTTPLIVSTPRRFLDADAAQIIWRLNPSCYNLSIDSHGHSCRYYCRDRAIRSRIVLCTAIRLSRLAVCAATDVLPDQTSACPRRADHDPGWLVHVWLCGPFVPVWRAGRVQLFSSLANDHTDAHDHAQSHHYAFPHDHPQPDHHEYAVHHRYADHHADAVYPARDRGSLRESR